MEPRRRSPLGRALVLASSAALAALLAMVVSMARHEMTDGFTFAGLWSSLRDPVLQPVALLVAGLGALLGWIGSLLTLLHTRLRVSVPVVTAVAIFVAALGPSGAPFLDAPFVLVAAWTAMIACRLAGERAAVGDRGSAARPGFRFRPHVRCAIDELP